ncbi:MAG: 6-carboxyhexanoate--CoA ligase [Hydrogenothermaceae bacterium]|nr:6-carboxyhexanoate--CoA ligase [Hydrogenothermaceae bacterium]
MRYFSIKMRASFEGKHISGGERIVEESKVENTVNQLIKRPNIYDFLNIKVEKIREIDYIEKSLDIENFIFEDYMSANSFAVEIISRETGIDKQTVKQYIDIIHRGASPSGEVMRGAMIVNQNGERVEIDRERGIRTTNIDFENREDIEKELSKRGYTFRTVDALALATKNLKSEYILAEYCISDDPDYITGYVALKDRYIRITPLKENGNQKGGRIYFVKNNTDLVKLYDYLEKRSFLIKDLGEIK